jgi:hypothetical protein
VFGFKICAVVLRPFAVENPSAIFLVVSHWPSGTVWAQDIETNQQGIVSSNHNEYSFAIVRER